MSGQWEPLDLMNVRDVADIVPKMTQLGAIGGAPSRHLQPRPRGLRVHRGEVRQEGIRQFSSPRKSVGGEDA
jgi:hypothetical protein